MICIFANKSKYSKEIKVILEKKLEAAGYAVSKEFREDAQLIICVGGDGSFLHTLRQYDFPETAFIGINTGHLGFFQEIDPSHIDEFIKRYQRGEYKIQKLKTIKTILELGDGYKEHEALNEVVLRKEPFGSVHFHITLGDSFVQRFSGDGILVCPPAGSTAYNYALGGAIVDPRLDLLQITPIAPMNTTAYRSFTSSLMVPPQVDIHICPEFEEESSMRVIADGVEYIYNDVKNIRMGLTDKTVQLLRFDNYDFWSKVKSKFL